MVERGNRGKHLLEFIALSAVYNFLLLETEGLFRVDRLLTLFVQDLGFLVDLNKDLGKIGNRRKENGKI